MNEGKTTTWFKYASSILPDNLGIDIIFKMDSDSMIYPRSLLTHLEEKLKIQARVHRRPAKAVYGGLEYVRNDIRYMQGGLYFLSTDVASYVTSDACPRAEIVQRFERDRGLDRAEDREMGLFVEQCWKMKRSQKVIARAAAELNETTQAADRKKRKRVTRWVYLDRHDAGTHELSLKDSKHFRVQWKKAFARDVAQLRFDALLAQYSSTNGCPPTKEEAASVLAWFDQREKMKQSKIAFSNLLKKKLSPCSHFES